MPRFTGFGSSQRARFCACLRENSLRVAAVVKQSLNPQLLKCMPCGATSPGSCAFFRRKASPSMPIASASLSMWASTAKVACRLPYPRNDPA